MTLLACAERVARGDPDRFRVAMAAPDAAREVLLPLYAYNLEVARAPWAAREPMLAEMRIQWWRDVVANAAAGAPLPAHEVAGPLAALVRDGRLDPAPLDAIAEGRRRDIDAEPFAPDALAPYLEATAGNLLWAGAKALGEPDARRPAAIEAGAAMGLAGWFQALPALAATGRGLADATPDTVRALASDGLAALDRARAEPFGPGIPALRAASLAKPVLRAARRDPAAVHDGQLAGPEGLKRLRLIALAALRRW